MSGINEARAQRLFKAKPKLNEHAWTAYEAGRTGFGQWSMYYEIKRNGRAMINPSIFKRRNAGGRGYIVLTMNSKSVPLNCQTQPS